MWKRVSGSTLCEDAAPDRAADIKHGFRLGSEADLAAAAGACSHAR